MKAIFIPTTGSPNLDYINRELKDCKKIVERIGTDTGIILIINNVTRKEKLEKINRINE